VLDDKTSSFGRKLAETMNTETGKVVKKVVDGVVASTVGITT
jgi:hypothetical protein